MSSYLKNIKDAFSTMAAGLKLTFGYLADARKSRKPIGVEDESYFEEDKGIVTLQYPYESFPVPDNGRYRLHNEIDDCIVCDKCAKVCPVDCIDIDAIRAPETYGMTSDGTPKRIHAAKFDIDMSKCCFCGLCTTVCPTECLTMTKVYDFSEFEVEDHVYSFSDMNLADIAQKRKELEEFETEKAKAKEAAAAKGEANPKAAKPAVRPKSTVAKPKVGGAKPKVKPKTSGEERPEDQAESPKKPVVPKMKPASSEGGAAKSAKPVMKPKTGKPVIKPKPAVPKSEDGSSSEEKKADPVKPVMKPKPTAPKVKPVIKSKKSEEAPAADEKKETKPVKPVMKKQAKPKPVIKPKSPPMDSKAEAKEEQNEKKSGEETEKPKFRPRPVIKRKPKDEK